MKFHLPMLSSCVSAVWFLSLVPTALAVGDLLINIRCPDAIHKNDSTSSKQFLEANKTNVSLCLSSLSPKPVCIFSEANKLRIQSIPVKTKAPYRLNVSFSVSKMFGLIKSSYFFSLDPGLAVVENNRKPRDTDWLAGKVLKQQGNRTIELRFALLCPKNRFGASCAVECFSTAKLTCRKNGTQVCLPRWKGSNCRPEHLCSGLSCSNGGSCSPNGTCACPAGFHGVSCQLVPSAASMSPLPIALLAGSMGLFFIIAIAFVYRSVIRRCSDGTYSDYDSIRRLFGHRTPSGVYDDPISDADPECSSLDGVNATFCGDLDSGYRPQNLRNSLPPPLPERSAAEGKKLASDDTDGLPTLAERPNDTA